MFNFNGRKKLTTNKERPKPFVFPEFCKGCGRCIEACTKGCISMGTEINPATGLIPIQLNLEKCTACGLCIAACPEPFGLRPLIVPECEIDSADPSKVFGEKERQKPHPKTIPDKRIPLPETRPMVIKGTYASAIGAILAGCRHLYGYPITPSTEGTELMAKFLPKLNGVFFQALSEVATANMMYGTGGAGLRSMTFTSSPGFSLMLEGISYMVGAELPGVFVNIMRGGPGLGNIGPEQADIKLACRGLGHGNSYAIVLAPATPQEMLDLTIKAFDLSMKYKNPVVILGDGYLGQITGKVQLPKEMIEPGIPDWAVYGDGDHRENLISSIRLSEVELSEHNIHLNKKYQQMIDNEQMAHLFQCDDAEHLVVACNTPSQMAMGAVHELRSEGHKVGLFRPMTLWPFPINELNNLLPNVKSITVVEASNGQLEDEMRLALSYSPVKAPERIEHVRAFGGLLPQLIDVKEKVLSIINK